jgi:soluble lytic murein transglycosylase
MWSGSSPWREEAFWELSTLLEETEEWEDLEYLLLSEPLVWPDLRSSLHGALAAQGKLSALEGSLESRGEDDPILSAFAAVGTEWEEDRLIQAVRDVPAQDAFLRLRELAGPGESPADQLINAKADLVAGEAGGDNPVFLALLDEPWDLSPSLVEDLVKWYRGNGASREGARRLSHLSRWENLDPALAGALHFAAGQLFRWTGQEEEAIASFREALDLVASSRKERVLWYLQDLLLRRNPRDAAGILALYGPEWNDPVYYEDSIDTVLSLLLQRREWQILKETADEVIKYGSSTSRAQARYVTARTASYRGEEEPGDDLFRQILRENPTGVYGWYARYHLGFWADLPGQSETRDPGFRGLPPVQDPVLSLYIAHSLADRAVNRWERTAETGVREDKLAVTAHLQESGRYLDSLWFLGGVGMSDPPEAWYLRYPRGYKNMVEEKSFKYSLPAPLLFALIRSESGFNASIKSWAGAVGLAQLMPATAVDVASRMGRPPGDLTDPEENLELGAWYLRWLQGYVGAPWSAVLAYNGGPGRVRSWLSEWEPLPPDLAIEAVPLPETRNYGRNLLVSSLYYGYLYYQLPPDLGFQNFFGTGLF